MLAVSHSVLNRAYKRLGPRQESERISGGPSVVSQLAMCASVPIAAETSTIRCSVLMVW